MKIRYKPQLALITALLPFVFITGCLSKTRTTILTNPSATTAAPTHTLTRNAIVEACKTHEWAITSEEPGVFNVTKLAGRKHEIELVITFDDDQIQIQYVNSSNLKYRKERNGTEYIHSNYFVWVNSLSFEIKKNVSEALLATSSD